VPHCAVAGGNRGLLVSASVTDMLLLMIWYLNQGLLTACCDLLIAAGAALAAGCAWL
jgi:hypothetical protein